MNLCLVRLTPAIIPAVVMILCLTARAENWTGFQNGGLSQTVPAGAGQMPAFRDEWRVAIKGYGQSSPVIWEDQVYVTSVSGSQKDTYHVASYALKSGELIWIRDYPNPTPVENNNYVSRAAPTPAVDARGVICFFEGGLVVSLDHRGEPRWQRQLVSDYGPISARHGLSASVEQNQDSAFVWVERSESPYVLALDKRTGETRWQADGVGATSWASPRLVTVGESAHLVLSAIGSLTGLDPATGEKLWVLQGITGNSSPTPIPLGDGRMLVGATVGRGETGGGQAARSNGVVRIQKTAAGQWSADYVWRAEKATSSFGSPLAAGQQAYFVNRSGVVFCLDMQGGQQRATGRIGDSIWATPFALGSFVVFPRKDGVLALVKPGPDCDVVGEVPLQSAGAAEPESTLYAAVAVDDRVIRRLGDSLICTRMQSP